jgi:HK97 family phage prohead protease
MIRFTASPVTIEAKDGEGRREIMGVAAPYNVEATVSDGTTVKFLPGSLPTDGPAPKLIQNHDLTQAIGVVTERAEDENGVYFVARISKTAAGNDALELAKDGVLDAVSVGAEPIEAEYDDNGTLVVALARWVELSLVPLGAFPQAKVTQVAAAEKKDKDTMSETPNQIANVPAPVEVPAASPSAPVWAAAKTEREFPMPTAGEYMAAYHIGGATWANVNAAYKQNVAKKQTAIEAALAQDLTTDTPGLLPTPVLGPVFQDINFLRPVVNAIGVRAMPNGAGKSFIRPTITQHTAVGTQTEGSAVTSQKATIASNTVTRTTVAGGVFLSQQDIDFTDPAALQAILNDLSGEYLMKTDDIACDNLVSASSVGGAWSGTAVNLMEVIYSSAQDISTGTNLFPTHIVASIGTWRAMGELVDNQDRPIFPFVGQPGLNGQNTLGAGGAANWSQINPLGLAMVVDTNVAANTFVILHAPAYEIYENVRGIMTVEDPELLGRNFTYYGYFATFLAKSTLARKWTH